MLGSKVYYYAFINTDIREAYAIIFEKIFDVLYKIGKQPIKFGHIHGGSYRVIRTVSVNIYRK